MAEGQLVVVTGTSGAGKTTAVEGFIEESKRTKEFTAIRLVTATTRAPRPNERDGVDYLFLPQEEFLRRQLNGDFVEFESNYADPATPSGGPKRSYYGSPLADLRAHLATYDVTFAVLDPKGAATYRMRFGAAVAIVALDAVDEVLTQRLIARGQGSNIDVRLAGAAEDRRIAAAIPGVYRIRTDRSSVRATMHRLTEIVRHRRSLPPH